MRRISFSIPDELDLEVQAHLEKKDAPPTFSALMRTALREFLLAERLRAQGHSVHELQGILFPPDRVLTIEQMDEVIALAGEVDKDKPLGEEDD